MQMLLCQLATAAGAVHAQVLLMLHTTTACCLVLLHILCRHAYMCNPLSSWCMVSKVSRADGRAYSSLLSLQGMR
jgi:hypothetical protein